MATGWAKGEDAFLAAMWSNGETALSISRQLEGRSRSAVLGRILRLKLTRQTTPKACGHYCGCGAPKAPFAHQCWACYRAKFAERDARIIAAYRSGLPSHEIGKRLELPRSTVTAAIRKFTRNLPRSERVALMVAARRYVGFERCGRAQVWPDCPAHLRDEYRRLQHTYRFRASEARLMLDPGASANEHRKAA